MAEKERTMLKTIVANTLIEGRALSEYDYLYCRFGMEIEKNSSHRLKNARLSPEDKWGMKRVETLTICLVDPNSGTEPHWPVQAETVISRYLYALHMYLYSSDSRFLYEVEVWKSSS